MMQKLMNRRNKKGFTLIELIVVIAIIAILAAILIPRFGGFTDKAKLTQAIVDAKQIATAADSLIAEGMTSYVAANADATDKIMGDSEIYAVAGLSSGITAGSWGADHFGFTYTLTVGVKNYKVVRTTAGVVTNSIS